MFHIIIQVISLVPSMLLEKLTTKIGQNPIIKTTVKSLICFSHENLKDTYQKLFKPPHLDWNELVTLHTFQSEGSCVCTFKNFQWHRQIFTPWDWSSRLILMNTMYMRAREQPWPKECKERERERETLKKGGREDRWSLFLWNWM